MAGIQTSIQLQDHMSPVLNNIAQSVNLMLNSFRAVRTAMDSAMNTTAIQAVQQELSNTSAALIRYREELDRVSNIPPPQPQFSASTEPAPAQMATTAPPMFTNTGAQDYEAELDSANLMARQLYQSQVAISVQAMRMSVTPDGMISDITVIKIYLQSLLKWIQELNSVPVGLSTDQVKNELLELDRQIVQVQGTQEELTRSMSQMDIGVIDVEYREVDSTIVKMEGDIRSNVAAQESLNESIVKGGGGYSDLLSKVGNAASKLGIDKAVKDAAIQMYESAVQLEATEAKYNTVFAGMTDTSDQFITEFQRLTPATTAGARSMASGIQGLLVPMGMQRSEATEMTGEMMRLIGALSNFNNATKTADDVSGAFQSAISGEYDSLNDLGIQVDENIVKQQAVAMGLASSTDAVSAAARAQTVLALATQQSGAALNAYNEKSLDTATRMQILKSQFQDAFAQAGQTLLPRINTLLAQVQAYMPQITAGIETFAGVLCGVISIAAEAFGIIMDVGSMVAANWSWIAPIIGGVVAAIAAIVLISTIYNTIQTVSNGLQAIAAARAAFKTGATIAEAAASKIAANAQVGLNMALLACPLTWIVIAIIAAIAAIYIIVGAINKFAGTSISATGIVIGAFSVLKAHLENIFIYIWNIIVAFINFFYNVWNDPIAALQVLFFDLASNVIGYIANMAHAIEDVINKIPGVEVSITAGLDDFQKKLEDASQKVKDESGWKEIVQKKEFVDYTAAAKEGYDGWVSRKSPFEGDEEDPPGGDENLLLNKTAQSSMNNTAANTGNTAANTAAIADQMDAMDEELKYMRDAVEQEIINRFTLAELKVDVNNNNTLTKKTDFEDMGRYLAVFTGEFLAGAAEGGYA